MRTIGDRPVADRHLLVFSPKLNVVAKRKRTGITQAVEGKTFKLHVSQTKNYWQTTFRSSPTGC